MRRPIAIAFVTLALTADGAVAFSRCRLSAAECVVVADERYHLAAITDYERSIPSNRTPLDQRLFLIERARERFMTAIAKQPKRIAAEMVRLLICDTKAETEISGRYSDLKEDCR